MTHPDTFARLSTPAQLLTLAQEGIGAHHFYATYDQQQAALSVGEALDAVRQRVDHADTDTSTVYVLGGGSPRDQAEAARSHLTAAVSALNEGADPRGHLAAAGSALGRMGYTLDRKA
jgi:hypothetical protein